MSTVPTNPGAPQELDMEKLTAFVARFMGDMAGATAALMCALGDRLGLFQALAIQGPATSAELSERAGLNERATLEWLRCLASAGYVQVDAEGRFSLQPEQAFAFTVDGSPLPVKGAVRLLPALTCMVGPVAEAFRSGHGVDPGQYPAELYDAMQAMSASWLEPMLVQKWIPAVNGLQAKLERGAHVADVGCGRGRALIVLAQAFPDSSFMGFDTFAENITRARTAAREAGVDARVTFEQLDGAQALSGRHDLVLALHVLHDAADPGGMLRAIHKALDPDGTCLVLESAAADRPGDNTGPPATILYATSTLYCIPTSQAGGGPALGTLGLPPTRLRQLSMDAGFRSTQRLAAAAGPFNALYQLRP